jgi:hypothetical protein
MLDQFLAFRKTDRPWHLPILAGLCVGIPILIGYNTDHLQSGKLASLAGLVILYIQSNNLVNRMISLMTCSFGIMLSFTIGLLFSVHPTVAAVALGVYAFAVHLALYYLKMNRPPGNFFFIMIASVAVCMPFEPGSIPAKIGFVGLGTMTSFLLGLMYSLLTLRPTTDGQREVITITKDRYVNLIESITFGCFVGLALLVANLLKLDNPYWAPTSCAAVMQGISTRHIWLRSAQRVIGTFVGLGFAWLILMAHPSVLVASVSIIVLQIIVEFLVVRNYGIAVVFITILTIFLAESGVVQANPNALFMARFFDILVGSLIGALGGWILYNEQIHYLATNQIRRAKSRLDRRTENSQ